MTPSLPRTTPRDRELLDRLFQHEPLSTSELFLLFFSGSRTCRRRLLKLEAHDLLTRVYPARTHRGGCAEALWFLSPNGRRMIGAPARRPPGLSIPDLEHRRAVAGFFLGLVERSVTRHEEGLYRWLGEQQAQQGTGPTVRPDGVRPLPTLRRRDHLLPGDRPRHRDHTPRQGQARRIPARTYRRSPLRPRKHPARLRRTTTPRQSHAIRTTRPTLDMGYHRPRALHAPTRPRPTTHIQRASRRTSPRRPPRRGLPRPTLALCPGDLRGTREDGMSESQHSRQRPTPTPGRTPARRRRCDELAQAERSRSAHAARGAWPPTTAAPKRLTADDVMTAREVAELLHAPVSTVEDWARRDILPSVKIGKRRLYIRQNVEAVLFRQPASNSV